MNSHKQQNGSTLIEVLVASVIFALGILGVAGSLGQGVHASIDNNARAIASSVASQATKPLYLAANNLSNGGITEATFKTLLTGLDSSTVSGNNGRDNFLINVIEVRDSNNVDVLTTSPPYNSPIRLAIKVDYQGLNDTKSTKSNYTFVW